MDRVAEELVLLKSVFLNISYLIIEKKKTKTKLHMNYTFNVPEDRVWLNFKIIVGK